MQLEVIKIRGLLYEQKRIFLSFDFVWVVILRFSIINYVCFGTATVTPSLWRLQHLYCQQWKVLIDGNAWKSSMVCTCKVAPAVFANCQSVGTMGLLKENLVMIKVFQTLTVLSNFHFDARRNGEWNDVNKTVWQSLSASFDENFVSRFRHWLAETYPVEVFPSWQQNSFQFRFNREACSVEVFLRNCRNISFQLDFNRGLVRRKCVLRYCRNSYSVQFGFSKDACSLEVLFGCALSLAVRKLWNYFVWALKRKVFSGLSIQRLSMLFTVWATTIVLL